MAYTDQSGQEIKPGDKVLFHGESGAVELVADPLSDPHNWYVTQYGGGVMILESKVFGRVFLSEPDKENHLEFVARAAG